MYKLLNLKNQARLILAPMKETKAVTVLVLFKVGSRYEAPKINGVSHFLEHMLYKGTKKRPNTLAIARALDRYGADYNAFTTKDHTGFYVKIYHKKIELAIDILSDIIFHSKFSPKEIAREKGVITEEINMYEDNPLMYLEDLVERTAFGPTNLGRLIIGSRQNIKSFRRKNLVEHHRQYYQPHNMILSVAGCFDEEKVIALINRFFFHIGKGKIRGFKKVAIKQKRAKVHLRYQKTEQVQLGLAFPAFSRLNKDNEAIFLLAGILGGSMSSRLFIEVREKKGLCYYINSTPNLYEETGIFYIQAGLDKARIFEALKIIWHELKKMRKEGVTPAELKRAQDLFKGRLVLNLEESSEIASYFGKQLLLLGKIERPEERFKKIDQVKTSDIKRIAGKILKKEGLSLVIIGPYRKEKEFSRFIDQELK